MNILSEVIIPLSGVVFPAVVAFIRAVYNRWGEGRKLHRDSQFDKVNVEKRLATFRRINQLKNKKEMIDMFETLAHFPDTVMMLRNGDNTVDAHSLMGFFAIDEKIPIELLLESEPDDNLKQAISKFAFVNA